MEIIATDKATSLKLVQEGNAKLKDANILMFNLPAGKEVCGRACAGCYAMKEQDRWPSVTVGRNRRLEASKEASFPARISAELSKKKVPPKYFRIHSSGDFYSQDYVDSWIQIAKQNPNIIFYAYTKRKKKFDFSVLSSLPNVVLIDSMKFGKVNYGKINTAPSNVFICPDQKGSDVTCGLSCTWCQTKGNADEKGVWFVQH